MRIDAAATKNTKIFSDFFKGNKIAGKQTFLTGDFVIRDKVTISDDAMKKLYEYAEEASKSIWSDDEIKRHSNDYLRSIGETIERVGRQTELMKSLALLAQDSQLSQEDRLHLQKRMTQMQSDLYIEIHNMSFKLADEKYGTRPGPNKSPKEEIKADFDLTMKVLSLQEKKIKGDHIAIVKGDTSIDADADFIIVDNGDGTYSYIDENRDYADLTEVEKNAVQGFGVNANKNSLGAKENEGGKAVFTGSLKDIKTYLERYEDKTFNYEAWEEKATLSLKNAETAAKSAENLTRRIEELRKKQDDFIAFFKSQEGRAAIAEDIANPKPPVQEGGVGDEGEEEGEDPGDNEVAVSNYKFAQLEGSAMLSDVRLAHPVGIIEEMYAAWDDFLKDNIYKQLGFAGYWDEYLERKIF